MADPQPHGWWNSAIVVSGLCCAFVAVMKAIEPLLFDNLQWDIVRGIAVAGFSLGAIACGLLVWRR
jgi:hypothetical protein